MLTIAHSIKESRKGTQVLSTAGSEQQVAIQTLQLVHDGTNVMDTVAKFNAHALLYDANKRMTLLHGTQIVKTIG